MPRFRTPPETPETQNTRTLAIPDSREWLAVFSDALAETINPYNYTQKDSESLTPEAAALIAYEAYEAWLLASESTGTGDCPDCAIPDSDPPKPIIRRNPDTGRFERLGSGEQFGLWVPFWADESWPASGDDWPTIPDTHAAAEDPLCAAASNAAEVLKQVFLDVHDAYDNNIGADIAAADTVIFIGAQIGSILALPVAPAIELGYAAWKFFYSLMDGLFTNFWSDVFTENLICILKDNASIDDDGIVHFDYFGVQRQILETIWNTQSFVLLVAQVNYMLYIIGPDGLDACGATNNVEPACSHCGSWCVEMDWTTAVNTGLTLSNGYIDVSHRAIPAYVSTNNWRFDFTWSIDTTQCSITRVGMRMAADYPTNYNTGYMSATPANGTLGFTQNPTLTTGGTLFMSDDNVNIYSTGNTTTVTGYWQIRLASARNGHSDYLRIHGTGVNPFGASTC